MENVSTLPIAEHLGISNHALFSKLCESYQNLLKWKVRDISLGCGRFANYDDLNDAYQEGVIYAWERFHKYDPYFNGREEFITIDGFFLQMFEWGVGTHFRTIYAKRKLRYSYSESMDHFVMIDQSDYDHEVDKSIDRLLKAISLLPKDYREYMENFLKHGSDQKKSCWATYGKYDNMQVQRAWRAIEIVKHHVMIDSDGVLKQKANSFTFREAMFFVMSVYKNCTMTNFFVRKQKFITDSLNAAEAVNLDNVKIGEMEELSFLRITSVLIHINGGNVAFKQMKLMLDLLVDLKIIEENPINKMYKTINARIKGLEAGILTGQGSGLVRDPEAKKARMKAEGQKRYAKVMDSEKKRMMMHHEKWKAYKKNLA